MNPILLLISTLKDSNHFLYVSLLLGNLIHNRERFEKITVYYSQEKLPSIFACLQIQLLEEENYPSQLWKQIFVHR
jgi:hypothetical protein